METALTLNFPASWEGIAGWHGCLARFAIYSRVASQVGDRTTVNPSVRADDDGLTLP